MSSQNWVLRSATTQIVSDVSGLIIHKNERYWYNTDFEINCKQSELIKGRQIVRVIAHPMMISNFPSDYPDADALAKLASMLTQLLGNIMSPPEGKKITKLGFWEDANGLLKHLKAFENDTALFTLTWSDAGEATEETYNVEREDHI